MCQARHPPPSLSPHPALCGGFSGQPQAPGGKGAHRGHRHTRRTAEPGHEAVGLTLRLRSGAPPPPPAEPLPHPAPRSPGLLPACARAWLPGHSAGGRTLARPPGRTRPQRWLLHPLHTPSLQLPQQQHPQPRTSPLHRDVWHRGRHPRPVPRHPRQVAAPSQGLCATLSTRGDGAVQSVCPASPGQARPGPQQSEPQGARGLCQGPAGGGGRWSAGPPRDPAPCDGDPHLAGGWHRTAQDFAPDSADLPEPLGAWGPGCRAGGPPALGGSPWLRGCGRHSGAKAEGSLHQQEGESRSFPSEAGGVSPTSRGETLATCRGEASVRTWAGSPPGTTAEWPHAQVARPGAQGMSLGGKRAPFPSSWQPHGSHARPCGAQGAGGKATESAGTSECAARPRGAGNPRSRRRQDCPPHNYPPLHANTCHSAVVFQESAFLKGLENILEQLNIALVEAVPFPCPCSFNKQSPRGCSVPDAGGQVPRPPRGQGSKPGSGTQGDGCHASGGPERCGDSREGPYSAAEGFTEEGA